MITPKKKLLAADIISVIVVCSIFITPFVFMLFNSLKDRQSASLLNIAPPSVFEWENYLLVFRHSNFQILTAFKNSILLSFFSVICLVLMCSMAGFVLQRRHDSAVYRAINSLLLVGLMVPPAILPTIWILQGLRIYKTLFGMVMIETALVMPFTILLYRGFAGTIPREVEEAACIDGCNPAKMFFLIIFPMLKPITSTVIILNSITVFNDFSNPLYFWPGVGNTTVQLTLFNYKGQFANSFNMLFADVILITLPMFILFLLFSKNIVTGMTAGAVKG